jgi:hypothetical protein
MSSNNPFDSIGPDFFHSSRVIFIQRAGRSRPAGGRRRSGASAASSLDGPAEAV